MPSKVYDVQNGSAKEIENIQLQSGCGVGAWRPSWLKPFSSIKAFTFTVSLWTLFGNMNFSYYTAVISEIEKNFGLSSSITGFLKNVDNIGYLSTVLIFSHFCRYTNKPKLFSATILLTAFGIFLFAVPYFIYGNVDYNERTNFNETLSNITVTRNTINTVEYCDEVKETKSETEQICRGGQRLNTKINTGAIALFIISELIQGIGTAPKFALSLTHMDDTAGEKAPRYFAFVMSMRAFSPTLGFLLGAWAANKYVDLSDPGFSSRDPRWVGAWWVGFVVCAVCTAFWALPMILFPPILDGAEKRFSNTQDVDISHRAKDLPGAITRLLKNKLYVMITIALSFEVNMYGYTTFLPKYIAHYFGVSPGTASLLTGVTFMLSYSLGPIFMGQMMGFMKHMTPFKTFVLVAILKVISTLAVGAGALITCEETQWAGHLDRESPDLLLSCNSNCSCGRSTLSPVCADNINYFSPCNAGCTNMTMDDNTVLYFGCSCSKEGLATSGLCPKYCKIGLIWFCCVISVFTFTSGASAVPVMAAIMRIVSSGDKATALAVLSGWLQIMSFPAPIVFGMVIDTTCLVLQGCASSRRGACLLYDNDMFRYRLHGFSFAVKVASTFVFTLVAYISRGIQYTDDDSKKINETIGETKSVTQC